MSYFPSPMPSHDVAAIINHSIVDLLAIFFNLILLLASETMSHIPPNKAFSSYKLLLMNSAIIDLLSSTSMFLSMVLRYPSLGRTCVRVIFEISSGLSYSETVKLSNYNGVLCHCMYTLMLSTISQSLFNIAISFCYRLYALG
uniref:G protein-coupled receptor n=1 Tax=Pristionchus pacificus TaxID=54126 RepID=A0A8R1UX67_PRIPA